jgi:hypothetical protein
VHKLRTNWQLTPTDLEELERMLRDSGTGTPEDIERNWSKSPGTQVQQFPFAVMTAPAEEPGG